MICIHCHRDLPESDFFPSYLRIHHHICKTCACKYGKAYRDKLAELSKQPQIEFEKAVTSKTDGYTIRILNYTKKGEYKYCVDGNDKHFATNDKESFEEVLKGII